MYDIAIYHLDQSAITVTVIVHLANHHALTDPTGDLLGGGVKKVVRIEIGRSIYPFIRYAYILS